MPAASQLFLQLLQLCGQPLTDRLSLNDEPPRFPSLPAHVGESQKIKRLRFVLASPLPVFGCMAPELNQARLVRVQLQPELPHTLFPFGKKSLRVRTIFESRDDIIGVPDNDHVARRLMLPPVLSP